MGEEEKKTKNLEDLYIYIERERRRRERQGETETDDDWIFSVCIAPLRSPSLFSSTLRTTQGDNRKTAK